MILQELSILNYKNIREADLHLSPNINCFIGDNGQGKTNVLDAVYYLSFCRSETSPSDSLVITHGEDFSVVEGDYLCADGSEEHIYSGMKRGMKKHFKRNKKEYRRLSEHFGLIPLVMVSPFDTYLIHGAAEDRRKLMDIVIAQYDHSHIDSLNRYNKALQQRNALLKQEEEPDNDIMELWEEEMATAGEEIFQRRQTFTEKALPLFQKFYADISDEGEEAGLNYVSHCQRGPLLDVIRRDRQKDRAVGYSLHGIHRDDLEMMLNGYPMRREGSQGQGKCYVIALKLALYDMLRTIGNKETPLLLLDDIFDKLDAKRMEKIIKLVASDNFGQIFITDTNRGNIDKIISANVSDYKLFNVSSGNIEELTIDN